MAFPVAARLLLACAAALAAASPAIAREDDVDFAMALAARGYEDLAEKEAARMLQGAATTAAKENASFTRCNLLRRTALVAAGAGERADPKDVRAKFTAAIEAFNSFLKTYPQSRLSSEAESSVGNMMKDYAYFLDKYKEQFPAAEREGVAKEAAKTFDDAIAYLRKIKDREEEQDRNLPNEDEGKYYERNMAWYYLCVAMHDRAMIHPPGDALRNQHLTTAIDETTLLLEETEGMVFGFFAGKLLGNCYWHRAQQASGFNGEDLKYAYEWFAVPLDAVDIPDLDQWPAVRNVMLEAAFEFGVMCNAVGATPEINFPKLLVERITAMETKQPGMRKEPLGLQALVEKAKAIAKMGSPDQAVTLLNGISEEAKDSPALGGVDQLAKRALNEVLASIPAGSSIRIGADVLFKAAEGSRRDGDLGRAIRAYQRTLVSCEGEADPARRTALLTEYEAKCWERLAECYYYMERFLECYFAADVPVQKYLAARRTDEDASIGVLATTRVKSLDQLVRRTPKERQDRYRSLLKAAQDLIAKEFAWAGEDTVYGVARQKLGAANRLLGQGDRAGAEALYTEAIAIFRKIGEKDAKYRLAQVSIGECLVSMGKHAEGLQHLSAYLAARTDDGARDAPVPDRQAHGLAMLWVAEAHDSMKAPEKAIETLADFEDRYQGALLDVYFPKARYLRVLNLVAAKRGPEAEAQAELLRKESPDHSAVPNAALAVANELIQRSAKAAAADPKTATALKKKALDWYDFWLQRNPSPTADHYTRIGEFHSDVANIEKAAEYWTKALDLYTKAGNDKDAELLTVYLAGLLVDAGRFAEALPKFEVLFVKTPDDITPLREVFEQLKRRPSNVAAPIHDENLKKIMEEVEKSIAKDPDAAIARQAADVKKAAASGLDVELLVRAFVDRPEQRRALATAAVESILGFNAAMPTDLRVAVLNLVNRRPELMSNLAKCYQELAGADPRNPIRAVNLYSALIESAQDDFNEPKKAGSKYSERWFDWKYRWAQVYLATGRQHKAEVWLRVVCDIVRGMATLKEDELAEKTRPGFKKQFEILRDEADSELRKLGKDGCK